MMVAEYTVVVQFGLEELTTVSCPLLALRHRLFHIFTMEDDVSVHVTEAFGFPTFGRSELDNLIFVVGIESETSDKT